MGRLLLGLDAGLTVTKAVVYASDGTQVASASRRTSHAMPAARCFERDMDAVWRDCASVIVESIAASGATGDDIAAVGVTGHGDGLYLVDSALRPVRPAILSLDSRSVHVLEDFERDGRLDLLLALTGQVPFPGSTAALISWMAHHDPRSLDAARFVLSCKDWVKLRLTGVPSGDPTDASAGLTDVHTQRYSRDALRLYGADGMWDRLPPIVQSTDIAGSVTAESAGQTGLRAGTPVVSGLHDVDACAIGSGAADDGELSMVAGSFSINQTVASRPVVDARWLCRSFILPGRWLHLGVSPASASNLEWFASEFVAAGQDRSRESIFAEVEREVSSALDRPREVWYLPFLYGSPIDNAASAAFVGLRGWHSRADVARALYEGVVFNHLSHVMALQSAFTLTSARLTGGGSRSAVWSQMFADALGLPVSIPAAGETGALGAAICAGIGAGMFGTLREGMDALVRVSYVREPRPLAHDGWIDGFEVYQRVAQALGPLWRGPLAATAPGP